jgi:chromosome segregation ATPase
MQQDLEDEKNEAAIKDLENKVESYEAALKKKDFVIQDLENKVKDHDAALEKKDFVIHSMEGSLAEAQAEIDKLNSKLLIKSEKSEQEKKNLETSLKTEIEKNSNLQKSLKELQEKCLDFGNRCVQRLKDVFYSIGASSDKFTPLAKTYQAPLNTLRAKLMHLTKLSLGMPISAPC